MPKRSVAIAILFTLLLCHCATKHQPVEFAAVFLTRPEGNLNPEQILEQRVLEATMQPTPLEKKRMVDLYQIELRQLKTGSARFALVSDKLQKLKGDVESLEKDLQSIQSDLKTKYTDPYEKPVPVFQSAQMRKDYRDAVQLWNKDQTPLAIAKIESVLKDPVIRNKASKVEIFRFLYLRFRVALEQSDVPTASLAYDEMKLLQPCDPDSTQAGFLLALLNFNGGEFRKALNIYEGQCDSDRTASNSVRHKYWTARFKEPLNEGAVALYQEVANAAVPGYHVFLAQSRLGKQIHLPSTEKQTPIYLSDEFAVSGEIHELLTNAEDRLRSHLRRDANTYLLKASRILRRRLSDPDSIPALLYIAHLFSACGNHLEGIRIYSDVTSPLLEGNVPSGPILTPTLFSEMFPRPHAAKVDWLSRMWKIDPDFVYAIMRQESAFNPAAVSISDARGLMQLMPSLGRSLAKQWRFHPYFTDKALFNADENLKLGVYHLSQLQELIPHLALMAASYNAGYNRVKTWWKRFGNVPLDIFVELIPVNETRNYVKLVIRNFYFYKALRTNGPVNADLVPFKIINYPDDLADDVLPKNTDKPSQSARLKLR